MGQSLIALPQTLYPPSPHTPHSLGTEPESSYASQPAFLSEDKFLWRSAQHDHYCKRKKKKKSEMELKAFGSGIDIEPGIPPQGNQLK